MLMIDNLDKISGTPVGEEFVVGKIIAHREHYYIYLNDLNGNQKRDLKLERRKDRDGLYKLSYGNTFMRLRIESIRQPDSLAIMMSGLV